MITESYHYYYYQYMITYTGLNKFAISFLCMLTTWHAQRSMSPNVSNSD